MESVVWRGDHVLLLDQSLLPEQECYLELRSADEMAEAIRTMKVRGAPAIGIAAAYGVALEALATEGMALGDRRNAVAASIDRLAKTRPTAVNLFWALERMRRVLDNAGPENLTDALVSEALTVHEREREATRAISQCGAGLIPMGATVLTHCNAGMIATAALGTALGAIVEAYGRGRVARVYATETRPLCQGARLTVWELVAAGVPTTLITDSMVAHVVSTCGVTCVMVGADRIAANGDVANKIGTYGIAVIAHEHGVPFYVAAPVSTIDLSLKSGEDIAIEERSAEEVTYVGNRRTAAAGCAVLNPAFDVTPHHLVSAIVTERGIIRKPDSERLRAIVAGQ